MAGKDEAISKPSKTRRRRIAFRLAAVAVGLLPFVVLEVALRAFDAGKPTGYVDPFVGFSRLHPQFEKNDEQGIYETTHSRQLFFGRQEFAIEKPENGVRVFCLGGSTVRGRPYTVESAFARWMQLELAETDPSRKYEVVNCGGLSYASYRLAAMMKEVLQYEPDAIVLATGHNEFLENRTFKSIREQSDSSRWLSEKIHSLRTVTAARRVIDDWRGKADDDDDHRQQLEDRFDTRLDEDSGYASYHRDAEWRKNVVSHFEIALRGMVKMCQEAGVPLILVRLGSNLRDCPPFKHEPSPDLGKDEGAKKNRAFDALLFTATTSFEAKQKLEKADLEVLLEIYKKAEMIDPQHALLCYRLARVYDRLGKFEKAEEYYLKAKDNDVCPLRMLESMSEIITTVAEETDTPLVDARRLLESESPQGIVGNDFFLDHVHPTIGGHQRIARALVQRLRDEEIAPPASKAWTASTRRQAYEKHISGLSENFFGKALDRVGWLENWAQRDRMRDELAPNDTRGFLHLAHRYANLGMEARAWEEYKLTLEQTPEEYPAVLARALELFRQGRTRSAVFLLDQLVTELNGTAKTESQFARAVVALETDDRKTAAKLNAEFGKEFDKLPGDAVFRKAFPAALEQLRKL